MTSKHISYHGTTQGDALTLSNAGVLVAEGGGELGKGFYTGQYLHEAKAWATHKVSHDSHISSQLKGNVVCFSISDDDIENLKLCILDFLQASNKRSHIKKINCTRSFSFGVDMVWAPIVGSERASGDQYKWESAISENLINGPKTCKTII